MSSRLCVTCRREKTIRGVWYLTPGTGFVCETCFVSAEPPVAALS